MAEKIIDIEQLAQDQHNFNKGTEQGQELMERSFKEMGAGRSILIDRNGNIIAGNKSQKAAIAAGIKKVRIIETTGDELVAVKRTDVDIDSAEGRKMAYLDNLTTQVNLTWDQTELQAVQADVEGFDIADFGFDIEDLPQVTFPTAGQGEGKTETQTEVKEDDFDPDAHYETKVKAGEVWQLGEHRLMCGDSTDADAVAKLMNGERADLVFTDPPYKIESGGGGESDIAKSLTVQKSDIDFISGFDPTDFLKILPSVFDKIMNAYVFCNKDLLPQYLNWAVENGYGFNVLIWKKPSAIPIKDAHRPDIEYLLFFRKKAIWNHSLEGVNYSRCLEYSRVQRSEENGNHPTPKPIALIGNELQISSNKGSIVLDLFGGSGSTMIACEQLGRKCRMMELDPHYCTVIIARWEKLTGQKEIKLSK